jgi:hypothetical protein
VVKYISSSDLGDTVLPKFPYKPTDTEFPSGFIQPDMPLTILVVVDTEEEFDWHGQFNPSSVSVKNIVEQPLAQNVFDQYGVSPTYVIDYPVANDTDAVTVLRTFYDAGRCHIGAHLHPWVTPPQADYLESRYSYPGNLPEFLERQKIKVLTEKIAAAFGRSPTVYKAGRYGIGPSTSRILQEFGYQIDASVVPYTDFSADGGPDFGQMSNQIRRFGSSLVEMPLSVDFAGLCAPLGPKLYPLLASKAGRSLHLPGIAARLGLLERLRLTPEGHTSDDMIRQLQAGIKSGRRLFMLTYHSSSLLPGATPYVRSESDRQGFLRTIDAFLHTFFRKFGGTANTVDGVARQFLPAVS